jgi:putative flippase GtrA
MAADLLRLPKLFDSTLLRFAIVGVANTLLGLSIIYSLKWLFAAGDASANLIGYAIGFVASFFLNRQYTFRFRGSTAMTFVKFGSVVVAAYLINLAIVLTAARGFQLNGYLAQALGVLPYAGVTYLGCKYFVFTAQQGNRGNA